MPPERPKPRYLVLWIPAVAAGALALGLAVWGATHQTSPDEDASEPPSSSVSGSPSPSAGPEPSGGPSETSSGAPSGEPAVDARSLLREALGRWRDADTGAFVQSSVIPGIGRLEVNGVYELSTRSSEATQMYEPDGDEPVEIRFTGSEGVTYLSSPDLAPGLRTCWMRFDARMLAESSGVALVNGADSLPANVVALTQARATRLDPGNPDVVVGTVRLVDAAPLFGSGIVRALGGGGSRQSVEAKFRLADGELVGWRVSGRSLVAALRRADALAEIEGIQVAAVSSFAVDVEYADLGATDVDVRLPAPELRMTQAQLRSGEGCPAAR